MSDAKMTEVVIVSACRTPIGALAGALSPLGATSLGSLAISAAIERAGISKDIIDEVIMGHVITAGCGQAPARQAALGAGLPDTVPCTTINKVCGSGLQSVIIGASFIRSGQAEVVVAGGMESMSNAPYLLDKARQGYRLGHGALLDSVVKDGLWDVYNDYHMGDAAELCAKTHDIDRKAQDEYAESSYRRALDAIKSEAFKKEIVPVEIKSKKGSVMVVEDEEPARVNFEKMPTLRPVFQKDGTVTAANASSINDGAAAVILMSREKAESLGLTPLAKMTFQKSIAGKPEWFTTAPTRCIEAITEGMEAQPKDIDLYEINEAFAVVALSSIRDLQLDRESVNADGGAIALGHPIGASGARILVTLLHALERRDLNRGLATLCIGGGEACGVVVERNL